MTGEELKKILEDKSYLQALDIKFTIAYLLKKRLINPSTLIDEYTNILDNEKYKYKSHFIEADTCNFLLLNGDKNQKVFAKKRSMYNSKFNKTYQWTYKDKLSAEELKEAKDYFKLMYGFDPEEE